MRKLLLTIVVSFIATISFAQHYKTLGLEQYKKNLSGKYQLINRALGYSAEWTFSDKEFTCYRDGQNCVPKDIKKKTKVGAKTTYIIDFGFMDVTITIANGYLTWIEGEDNEDKMVYRIIKTEKLK